MLHLANNIVFIRKLLAETQPVFAKRFTGVSLGMQKSYEGGGTIPSALYISELSDLSGVTQENLLNKQVEKGDVDFEKKVKKDKENSHFSADQLFAMYMKAMERQDKIMEAQTLLLTNIQNKMAQEETQAKIRDEVLLISQWTVKAKSNLDLTLETLRTVAARQEADEEIILHSLARVEGLPEKKLFQDAGKQKSQIEKLAHTFDKNSA